MSRVMSVDEYLKRNGKSMFVVYAYANEFHEDKSHPPERNTTSSIAYELYRIFLESGPVGYTKRRQEHGVYHERNRQG